MATPTNGHAPYFLQPSYEHAVFTRSLLSHWLKLRTHSIVIGGVLPPAGACCEFCFSFFLFLRPMFYTHSWEKREPVKEKKKTTSTPPQQRQQPWRPPSLCPTLIWQYIKSDFLTSSSSMPARKFREMESNEVRRSRKCNCLRGLCTQRLLQSSGIHWFTKWVEFYHLSKVVS